MACEIWAKLGELIDMVNGIGCEQTLTVLTSALRPLTAVLKRNGVPKKPCAASLIQSVMRMHLLQMQHDVSKLDAHIL